MTKRKKRALIALAALFLYLLSVGPVCGFFLAGKSNPNPIIGVAAMVGYSPLLLIASLCPPFERALGWYVDICWRATPDYAIEQSNGGD